MRLTRIAQHNTIKFYILTACILVFLFIPLHSFSKPDGFFWVHTGFGLVTTGLDATNSAVLLSNTAKGSYGLSKGLLLTQTAISAELVLSGLATKFFIKKLKVKILSRNVHMVIGIVNTLLHWGTIIAFHNQLSTTTHKTHFVLGYAGAAVPTLSSTLTYIIRF